MTIVYQLGNKLYLNITNSCSCDCVFCIRNHTQGVGDAESLWLEREPNLEEIKTAIDEKFAAILNTNENSNGSSPSAIDEIVFCGYGEPMERASDVIAISQYIKNHYSSFYRKPALLVRLNTNGLVFLMHPSFDISQLAIIDTVSISLNADDPEEYQRVSQPRYGEVSYDSLLEFARQAKAYTSVVFSVVDGTISAKRMENCRRIAEDMGIPLRVR